MTRRSAPKGAPATAATAITDKATRLEYRIRWKRAHWSRRSNTKSRVVQSSSAVERFLDRVVDVGEVSEICVDVRECGPWKPIKHPRAS